MFLRRRRGRDERGAILVLASAGMVVAVISAALAIDIGFLAHEARVDQKVADLAAVDAIRVLPSNPTATAQASATRNNFPYTATGYALVVEWSATTTGPWASTVGTLAAATAVRVTATSPHQNFFPFVAGGQSKTRRAVASLSDRAQFSVGSNLATLNTGNTANLNRVMTALLGSSSGINLTLAGYQGLAGGSVSLADLVAADPSLGTADSLLTSSVTVKKLALATVQALNNKGDAASLAAATALAAFASNIKSTLNVTLGAILDIEQPASPGSVSAATQFSVLDLITGAGQAAVSNGTNFVDVTGLAISVPGLVSSSLRLTIIEPPQISAFGVARYDTATSSWVTTAKTAQIKVEFTAHIIVGSCSGLLPTCVDLTMPLVVTAAQAVGSLTDVRCPTGSPTRQADIQVETAGANATANNTLTSKLLGVDLLPPGSLVSTNVAIVGSATPPPTQTHSGPPFPTPIQSTAATGAGLAVATQAKLTLLGYIPVGPVLSLLSPVMTAIDTEILDPMFDSLGLSLSGADVRVLRIECGVPGLVG